MGRDEDVRRKGLTRRELLRGASLAAGAALGKVAMAGQTSRESEMNMESWLAMPDETEPKILEWQERHRELVHVDHVEQYCGRKAYAVTVSDKSAADAGKKKHIFSQPHAHEPAPT
ncbi:MAG: hypothetical protein ACE5JM_02860, partial [Armatimonadota bacterium]